MDTLRAPAVQNAIEYSPILLAILAWVLRIEGFSLNIRMSRHERVFVLKMLVCLALVLSLFKFLTGLVAFPLNCLMLLPFTVILLGVFGYWFGGLAAIQSEH